ncbi:MAG: hypothetical protein WC011_00810 [Candidatus Paceibacterota bacterium]
MKESFTNNSEGDLPKNESPLHSIYSTFDVLNSAELHDLYFQEDQRLMDSYSWDYEDSDLIINKIKNLIENVGDIGLTKEEKDTKESILWFWYHHATSCALFQKKDKEKAKLYSTKALEYKDNRNSNQITKLLYFLANDDLTEATNWADNIENPTEKQTALSLIKDYKSLNLI